MGATPPEPELALKIEVESGPERGYSVIGHHSAAMRMQLGGKPRVTDQLVEGKRNSQVISP